MTWSGILFAFAVLVLWVRELRDQRRLRRDNARLQGIADRLSAQLARNVERTREVYE